MAQIRNFTSTNDSYFVLDGVSYPKVYEAMLDNGYTKDRVKLVGTNRDSSPLVFSTHYSNIRVDGASFSSAQEAISRLNQVVFSKGGGSGDGGTGIQSVQPGTNITVDNTDPLNPIVNSTGGGDDIDLTAYLLINSTDYDGSTITATKDDFNYYTERSAGDTTISKVSNDENSQEKGYASVNSEGYVGVGYTTSDGVQTTIAFNAKENEEFNVGLVANRYLYDFLPLTSYTDGTDGNYFPQVKWVKDYTYTNSANLDGSNIPDKTAFVINLGLGKNAYRTGGVVTTANTVTLLLKQGGNELTYNGVTYVNTEQQEPFIYTPVSAGKINKLVIFGMPTYPYFYFEEGMEGNQAVDPILPEGAYVIYEIIVKDNETVVTGGYTDESFPGQGINDVNAWSGAAWYSTGLKFEQAGVLNQKAVYFTTHNIAQRDAIQNPKNGFVIYLNDGIEPRLQKYNGTEWEDLGGGAKFPEGGSKGDILEKDSAEEGGVKWSNRLTTVETAITDLYIAQAKFTVTSSITNETLSTVSNLKQNNRNNLIANGVNAINITLTSTAEAKFQAIYHKLGSGTITFVAGSGVSLVLIDGTDKMEGTAGFQTASVHRDGNKYYVQISNR